MVKKVNVQKKDRNKLKIDFYTDKIASSPNLQIYRKFIHLILGTAILLLGYLIAVKYSLEIITIITFLSLLILLIIDLLRVEFNINFPLYTIFTKQKEKRNLHALTFAFLAAVIVIIVYDFRIALASLSMSIFSDAIAAIVGIKFGRHRFKNGKSLEGSLSALIVNLLIGYFILKTWYIFIPMALIATLTELVIIHMDDNFIVPIFAGFIGQLILILSSIF